MAARKSPKEMATKERLKALLLRGNKSKPKNLAEIDKSKPTKAILIPRSAGCISPPFAPTTCELRGRNHCMKTTTVLLLLLCVAISTFAQAPASERQQFIRVEAPVIALTHVRVIDGTGAAARDDQTIVITDGKIQSIGPSATANVPANAQTIDLKGYTVLPGLVGMHDHMFFPVGGSPPMYSNMGISFPRLYLALGVTTIRTTGSVAPYTDLEIKRLIDAAG